LVVAHGRSPTPVRASTWWIVSVAKAFPWPLWLMVIALPACAAAGGGGDACEAGAGGSA
jgi:hypothetical protein